MPSKQGARPSVLIGRPVKNLLKGPSSFLHLWWELPQCLKITTWVMYPKEQDCVHALFRTEKSLELLRIYPAVEYKATQFSKEHNLYSASRYTHSVTANQILIPRHVQSLKSHIVAVQPLNISMTSHWLLCLSSVSFVFVPPDIFTIHILLILCL